MEAKNAANVATALAGYSFKTCPSKVIEQDKPVNIQTYTFKLPSSSAPKVPPSVSESPYNVFTSEQAKLMKQMMEDQAAKLINEFNNIQRYANLKKSVNVKTTIPSYSLPVSLAPKTIQFPYGMLMNVPKSQVGPSAVVVGSNALIANATYTTPITSVPQTCIVEYWIDDDLREIAGFKAPFTTVAYGPRIAPEGIAEPNPVPPYVFNHPLNT